MYWLNCLSLAWSIRRWLWAAFGWCLRWWTAIGATCTGALCAWAARWGTGQRHWRLSSGGLWYRLRLAGWESLDDGCGSLRSECLVFTTVCLIGMSRSGSVTFSLKSLLFLVEVSRPGCLLGGIDTVLVTGLSPNLVILARLLGWTLLSGTVSET